MTEVTSCLSIEEELLPTSKDVSRNVIRPQFSMAPARKSGIATRSIDLKDTSFHRNDKVCMSSYFRNLIIPV